MLDMKSSKLILVTGGAGFIGSHLCKRLYADGHKVISLDNYFTGSRENHVEGVEYREGHTKDIESLVPESPDLIYHLGEYSRIKKSLEEPEAVFDLNMKGTFGVLEFWRKGKGKLIYAGSSTKFTKGNSEGITGKELSPYSWSKATNSELVHNYGRWYELPYSIAYFYNVYGPGERAGVESYGTVIESFRQNMHSKKPLQIHAPGTQTRSFTHIDDTIEGLIVVGEKGKNEEYPISAKETYSLLEVAQMFGGEVVILPATKSSRSSSAEDTRLIESFGWRQKHSLLEYIDQCKKEVPL
jgi:UDP-glucose 4-epimerase